MNYAHEQKSVKKPRDVKPLSKKQEKEFEKCAFDFFYWTENYAFVQSPKGKTLFKCRSYQERLAQAFIEDQFIIALCPRQSGKSQLVALYLLHSAIFFPDELIGVTSYKNKNVKDVMNKIKYTYESLPFWMKPAVKEYNQFTVKFTNNSTISSEVTNSNTFRGETLTKLFSDELAYVTPLTADEWWVSILPTIESDGEDSDCKMIITSTPNGTAGKFAEIWFKAKQMLNGFTPIEVKWNEIPGRTPEFKKKMLGKMNKNKYLQEYECVGYETEVDILNDGLQSIGDLYDERDNGFTFNDSGLKVRTSAGFKGFHGISKTAHDKHLVIDVGGVDIKSSFDHLFWCDNKNAFTVASDLRIGDVLTGKLVASVRMIYEPIDLYELVEVEGHHYYTNGIISHNCNFLSDKGTLINSAVLEEIITSDPILQPSDDLKLWVTTMRGMKVAAFCDVSEGVGQDYHAVQLLNINTMEQIGEFANNDMNQSTYTREIVKILKTCFQLGAAEVYYSIENNSIGMGILSLLESIDDDTLDNAQLITHEDSKKPGMPMNRATKPHGCQKLKDLVEQKKIILHSEKLVNELKFFVKSGNSFSAENGMHDDLAMSMVGMALLLEQLADFEEEAYDAMAELTLGEDDSYAIGIF